MFVDGDRTMYIADMYNHRVQMWTDGASVGSTVAGTGVAGTADSQLYYPISVVVDSNQYMYIADEYNNRIQRWAPGACAGQCLVGCSRSTGAAADRLYYPQSVAFDSQRALYVSDGFQHRIQKFTMSTDTGKNHTHLRPTRIVGIRENSHFHLFAALLSLSSDFDWAPDGNTVAGSATGTGGTSSASLSNNLAIQIVDSGNNLYIADTGNNRVALIQPSSTNATRIFGSVGTASNQFNQPTDIFVTNTAIYVLDASNYRVQMWPRNGSSGTTVAGITGSAGSAASSTTFSLSYGIFVDTTGYLYVSDQANHRVLRFPSGSTSGTSSVLVAGTGISGPASSQLSSPNKIFVDDASTVYIADTNNHRIQKWVYGACAGVTVAGTGIAGSDLAQLQSPVSIMVDANGYMYISDRDNQRILRWSPGSSMGKCIAGCSGIAGTATNQLSSPSALAFDSNGLLYVSDKSNNRVQKFSLFSTSSKPMTMA